MSIPKGVGGKKETRNCVPSGLWFSPTKEYTCLPATQGRRGREATGEGEILEQTQLQKLQTLTHISVNLRQGEEWKSCFRKITI